MCSVPHPPLFVYVVPGMTNGAVAVLDEGLSRVITSWQHSKRNIADIKYAQPTSPWHEDDLNSPPSAPPTTANITQSPNPACSRNSHNIPCPFPGTLRTA